MTHPHRWCAFLFAFAFPSFTIPAVAQPREARIIEYVRRISRGETDRVAGDFSLLRNELPASGGIVYVQGLVSQTEGEAVRCFRIVADSFPGSEWADDALARLFDVHRMTGRTEDAALDIEQLRSQYPRSPYVTARYNPGGTSRHAAPKDSGGIAFADGEFAVQVGAFSKKRNAERLAQRFRDDGWRVDTFDNLLDGHLTYYLVWIRSYESPEEAQRYQTVIESKYKIHGVIRQRTGWKKW